MKKKFLVSALFVICATMMTSCYTYTFEVGDGAQSGVTVEGKNQYFIAGLAQGKQTDPAELAGGAENYTVTIQHTFIDGLLNAITFGIYTPTTTKVQK